jgi:hypothetical protein
MADITDPNRYKRATIGMTQDLNVARAICSCLAYESNVVERYPRNTSNRPVSATAAAETSPQTRLQ